MFSLISTAGVDIPGPIFFHGILDISGPRSLSGIGISGRYAQGVCPGMGTLPLTSPLLLTPNGGHHSYGRKRGQGFESYWNVFL